ncbi:MAG: hypothetical protein ACON4H_12955 [Rubripirellula sp.]
MNSKAYQAWLENANQTVAIMIPIEDSKPSSMFLGDLELAVI